MKLFIFISVFFANLAFALPNCKNCNLIIIDLTSTRPRNMSFYGYHRDTTPNINRFFSTSYVFKNTFAPASLTYTDSISLFYSLKTNTHRFFKRNLKEKAYSFLKDYKSLTKILNENGYATAAFTSDEDYEYDWGVGKDFDLYFDRSKYSEYGIAFKPLTYSVGVKDLVPVANKWLEKNKNKKFFMFLQTFDMHCPYTPTAQFTKLYQSKHSSNIPFESECFMNQHELQPKTKNGKKYFSLQSFFAYRGQAVKYYDFDQDDLTYLKSRYDAELNKADYFLNQFLEKIAALNLEKNTIVIFLADHGDNLGENNFFMKSNAEMRGNLHNANLQMPLLFKIPNQEKKKIIKNQLIGTIDIAPTILDLLQLNIPTKMEGKSFLKSFSSDEEINKYLFGYSVRSEIELYGIGAKSYTELEYIQNHEWKLIRSKQSTPHEKKVIKKEIALYNLAKDPDELTNLAQTQPQLLLELSNLINNQRNIPTMHEK